MTFPARVVFVCGSLEPGRDGVGDYTRTLAEELRSLGTSVAIAAINDPWIDDVRSDDGLSTGIPTLRLPAGSVGRRETPGGTALGAWLHLQRPDWISLQFVPWSFHRKGVPFTLGPALRRLAPATRWHVMCHELWLDGSSGARHRLLGLAQQLAIRRTFSALRPRLLHVTLAHNANLLETIGLHSSTLPLFGNVPVTASSGLPRDDVALRVLFFGSPPPVEVRGAVIRELTDPHHARNRPLELRLAGGNDAARAAFVAELRDAVRSDGVTTVTDLGFLSTDELGAEMLTSQVGVVRNPGHMMGKSGTLIAMLEHGMSIWAPAWGDEALDLDFRPDRLFRSLAEAADQPTAVPMSRRADIAARFGSALASPRASA